MNVFIVLEVGWFKVVDRHCVFFPAFGYCESLLPTVDNSEWPVINGL